MRGGLIIYYREQRVVVFFFLLLSFSLFLLNNFYLEQDLTLRRDFILEGSSNSLVAEVRGEIKNPGYYSFSPGTTLKGLIAKSGELKEGIILGEETLSLKIGSGYSYKIMVGGKTVRKEVKIEKVEPQKLILFFIPFEINTATLEEFKSIPGIGEKLARKIIEYRDRNGGFSTWEDLLQVSGIGPSKLKDLKEYLSFPQDNQVLKPAFRPKV